jgi:glutamate-1-semialdehyde 2,1-aminomutase
MAQLTLEEEYRRKFPRSHQLHQQALGVFRDGITHSGRYFQPFPIYVERSLGSRKWDVDGNEFVDYTVGHGSLILGHAHPAIVEAMQEQAAKGTHYGACQELEVQWGNLVQEMVPSAERVEFTSSGTEATMLAMRLCRLYTGRKVILGFLDHFHGWHDYAATISAGSEAEIPGVPWETRSTMVIVPPNDLEAVERAVDGGDIAGIIVEAGGAHTGQIPHHRGFLQSLRELATAKGVPLIMDEVITGFRYAPGGAQEYYGVTPDLTTMAKVLGGGSPCGGVAGKAKIMALLERRDEDPNWEYIRHPGTYNANPMSAASGVAALSLLKSGEVQRQANALADKLRQGMNEVVQEQGVGGCVYGECSRLIVHLGEDAPSLEEVYSDIDYRRLLGGMGESLGSVVAGMAVGGVHWMIQPMLSVAHSEEDLELTVGAFNETLSRMKAEGLL